jgi:hypothetical protein
MRSQLWKDVYEALLQEKDRSKLPKRCDNAELAIKERFHQLTSEVRDTTEERLELSKALHNVAVVRASLSHDPKS